MTLVETINGCTNPQVCNYDQLVTIDDGSCGMQMNVVVVMVIYLAMAVLILSMCNYDQSATIDDGSCEYATNGSWMVIILLWLYKSSSMAL